MDRQRSEQIALFRFSVVAEATNPRLTPAERGLVVRRLATQSFEDPDGVTRSFSRATLDRWVAAYRARGLAGLEPARRSDAGRPKDQAAFLAEAARLRKELPERSSATIVDAIGRIHNVWLSERTVRAHLAREGLSKASLASEPAKAFGRFQAERPNQLWCGDVCHGPFIPYPRVAGSRRARSSPVSDTDAGRPYIPPFGSPQWPDDGLCHHIQISFEVPSGPGVEIIAAEFLLSVVQDFTHQGLSPDSLTLQINSRLRPEH